MDDAQVTAASDLLYQMWTRGDRMDQMPAELRPISRADGYRIQSRLEVRSASGLFGWKIAATSKAGQAHIGVDGPLAGRILAERVIADGGGCSLNGNFMRLAELEFAFRMAADLPPMNRPYTVDEVMESVATLHPAIEMPDTRLRHFEVAGAAQLIADNACAHNFLLGNASTIAWHDVDLAGFEVWGRLDDEPARPGVGSNVLGDPRIALTWLVNELSQLHTTLRAGEVVTTGTCLKPIPVRTGNRLLADFGVLGSASVVFV
jgi:2-keto-4-pentenoate hydratase